METTGALKELDLPNVSLIAIHDFESSDSELLTAKTNLSVVEYFLPAPVHYLYIFENFHDVETLT